MTPLRWGVVTVAVLLCGATAAPARAGTYDVVSCGAPGAGGVNRAWEPVLDAFPGTAPEPGSFDFVDECPGPRTFLLARSRAAPGVTAGWARSAFWRLTAPAGTRISRIVLWRWGQVLRTDADSPTDPTDDWDILATTDLGNIGLEPCPIAEGQPSCETGAAAPMSAQSRVQYDLNTQFVRWGVVCNPSVLSNCQTAVPAGTPLAGFPRASLNIWGSVVTIRDEGAPLLTVSGTLLGDGWRRPSDALTYAAGDASGVRSVRIEAAGQSAASGLACDVHRPRPCGDAGGALTLPSGTPDGIQPVRVVAVDAAGNESAVVRQVAIDGNPPAATLERPRGRTIVVSVSDEASGVAGGEIQVRHSSAEPYRALATTLRDGRLTARLDRGRVARADIRVSVSDHAGNTAAGLPPKLTLTSARIGDRTRPVRRSRLDVPYGRGALVRGRLTLSAGQPLAGVPLAVTATTRLPGATARAIGSTSTTGRTGRFSFRVAPGPSRTLRFVFGGAGEAMRSARGLGFRVRASSTIHASRTRLSGPATVRFSGGLRRAGQRIPGRGLVLVLQGRERGRWRTFADTRTDAHGRWRARYRFSGRTGTYPIRVRVRRQNGFPFELGYSRTVRIRVR